MEEVKSKVLRARGRYISPATKKAVCEEYLRGTSTKRDLLRKYGIKGHSSIADWLRKFGYVDPFSPASIAKQEQVWPTASTLMENPAQNETTALGAKIKALQKQLADAELKALVYETMIEVAERELKIPIRKKPVTKQSMK